MSIGRKELAIFLALSVATTLIGAHGALARSVSANPSNTGGEPLQLAVATPKSAPGNQKSESNEGKKAEAVVAQRKLLQEARLAIANNDKRRLKRLKKALKDYPLLPYLDYWSLSKNLSNLPFADNIAEIDSLLKKYDGTALGDWIRIRVLRELGRRERFRAYLKYYRPEQIKRTQLRCYYVDALSRHGDKQQAYPLIEALWTVGASQPKECDPAFSRWIKDGGLTQDLAWKRHRLSVRAGNLDLAGYIARRLNKDAAERAALMRAVYRKPAQILNYDRFIHKNPQYRDIVAIGLRRLASRDAQKADTAWQRYSASYLFSDDERDSFLRYLSLQFARQDNQQGLEQLIKSNPNFFDLRTAEWLIRQSLREMDWAQVEFWINQLPGNDQNLDRWLYWKARAINEQLAKAKKKDPARVALPKQLYQKTAAERSYYGFLASDTLGKDYSFVDRPAPITRKLVEDVAARPGMQRAKELQAIGEFYHARREWDYATKKMTQVELMTAGKLASTWGWYQKSIQSILAADYLDDLELRFPLAFSDIVSDVASRMGKKTALDSYLVLAVARQESHFSHDAKSHAGAMGLMQLLPATAKATAHKAGVPYRRSWDLLNPTTNINLGAYYLNSLLNRFNNNRFLAAAAYNAGPTRVSRWLKNTNKQLPFDVWIETIPYSETRKYVQNVLSYSVIYAYRSGNKAPLLRKNEAEARL